MKTLILTHAFPLNVFRGMAYQNYKLVSVLALREYEVYIVAGHGVGTALTDRLVIYSVNFPNILLRSIWYSLVSSQLISKQARTGSIFAIHNNLKKEPQEIRSNVGIYMKLITL